MSNSMSINDCRYPWIDIAKGIGIILVIMGHTMFPLHIAIDVFHMPLFFFIAGLTFNYGYEFKDFLIKKINRIFIPYLFFYSLIMIFQVVIQYDGPGLFYHLWFLQCMFIALIIAFVVTKYLGKIGIWIMLFCLIYGWCLARYKMTILPMHIDRGIFAAGYILLGYYSKRLINSTIYESRKRNKIVLFIIAVCIYSAAVYCSVEYKITNYSFNKMQLGDDPFLFFITCISAILSVILFSQIWSQSRVLEWIGKNSLIIYFFHVPFTEYLNCYFSDFANGKGVVIGGLTAIAAYLTYLVIGSLFVPLCKRYLSKVSGYASLIQ